MRTVWVVHIRTAVVPDGYRLCECTRPDIIASVVQGLCAAFAGADSPPEIIITTELRHAPLPTTA